MSLNIIQNSILMVKLPQILTEQTTHDAVRSKHCDKEGMSLKS